MPKRAAKPPAPPIRVMLADDSTMVRRLLSQIVRTAGDMEIVGEAKNGREAIDLAVSLKPDVCLLDLEMPVMGGIEALPHLRAAAPLEVVVVSSIAQPGSDERRACIGLGATAVVAKPSGAVSADLVEVRGRDIVEAIRLAVRARLIAPDAESP